MGAPTPPRRRKYYRRNLQEKFVSAFPAQQVHPQAEQESNFLGHFFAGRGRFGRGSGSFSSFRQSFEGVDYKRSSTFLRKKCSPDKILAKPMYFRNA